MDEAPDNRELAHRIALLEERMNTHSAENETALERMNTSLTSRFDGLQIEIANRDKEAANRDKANIQWMAGLVLGAAVLIIAVLGILIRWPAPPV